MSHKFDLFPVGYACEDGEPGSGELLSNFFKENTSFLFYRRFFHDYPYLSPRETPAASGKWESHAVIRPLDGSPKFQFPEDYARRSINNDKIDSFKPTAVANRKPFLDSVSDWVKGLSAYYCGPFSGQGKLWAICIGSNIMPELRNIISKTQELNSSCAIFLTVWTGQTDEVVIGAASDFVGQIKARLAQWIAESLHRRLRERMDDLDRQAKTMELMARPLLGITDALARMQSDTQEIRALMFEPEEALFKSHIGIEPFFREGHGLPIVFPGCPADFRIRHTPNHYETNERVVVLACVMCSILGKLPSSEKAPAWGEWPAHAVKILNEASRAPSYLRLSDDLRWLVGLQPKENLGNILTATEEVQAKALLRLKEALFSPFKTDTGVWKSTAFRLLHRSAILETSNLVGELTTDCSLSICRSPITYAAVLSFVRDISLALSSREVAGRRVERLGWNADLPDNRFRMAECIVGFDSRIPNDSSGLDHKRLRSTLRAVAKRCPREWRIQDDNYGDTTRPFVYLVNKVIGLGPGIHDDWQVCDKLSEDEVFAIRSVVNGDAIRFSIDCVKTDVRLIWAKV